MPTTNFNKKGLNLKRWEPVCFIPSASQAGSTLVLCNHIKQKALYIQGPTTAWLYTPDEDGFVALSNPGITPQWTAGAAAAAGAVSIGSSTGLQGLTATAGTTSTITTNQNFTVDLRGYAVYILAGPNAGATLTIRSNTTGAGSIITVDTQAVAFSASTVYRLITPVWYALGSGALTSGSFRRYDWATNTWTTLAQAGLPGIGTDGRLITTPSWIGSDVTGVATAGGASTLTDTRYNWLTNQFNGLNIRITSGTGSGQSRTVLSNTSTIITVSSAWTIQPDSTSVYVIEGSGYKPFATGTATAGGAATLTNSGKNWTVNQWSNYQIRITGGTGAGQVRTISSNTATVITVSSNWATQPDNTSTYNLEGNDDFIYYIGNNAVTMYRYSISANTWTTLSPTAARGGAAGAGCSGDWIWGVTESDWNIENSIINGRRIYSFRGGAQAILDYYDIALNTWVSTVPYTPQTETFTTGSSYAYWGNFIYITIGITNRWLRLNVVTGEVDGITIINGTQSTAQVGNKAFVYTYIDGATIIPYLYFNYNSLTLFDRLMII